MTDRSQELLAALKAMVDRYTSLVNCGDCGNWDPETEPEVQAARAAIASADASAEVSVPVDVAVKRIRHWLVQSFRYTAGTIELDEVLRREITAAVSASADAAPIDPPRAVSPDQQAVIAEAREYLAPITQGEWRLSMSGYSVKSNDDDMPIVCNNPWGAHMKEKDIPRWIKNADFIIAAPRLVRSLLAALQEPRWPRA